MVLVRLNHFSGLDRPLVTFEVYILTSSRNAFLSSIYTASFQGVLFMPFAGETIPLSFQLLDQDGTKFCRAVLSNPSGTPLAGTPVAMTHLGGGKYTNDSVLMPNEDYVECRYEPYDDAAFTIPDPDHLVGTDVFRLEIPDSIFLDLLNQILNKLNGLALPGAAIKARVVQNKIKDVIRDANALKALVEHKQVKSVIENNPNLVGKVSQNQVNPKVDC